MPENDRVYFRTDNDARAAQVVALLGAVDIEAFRDVNISGDNRFGRAAEALARRIKFTDRERQILALVLQGDRNQEAAEKLGIARATVKWHLYKVYAKTNTGNRESLLRLAFNL